jgi:hypothetical protein
MITKFDPPDELEKTKTFMPRVAGPTVRLDEAETFVVDTVLDTIKLAKFETRQTFKVPTFPVVASTFVVEIVFETTRFVKGCTRFDEFIFEMRFPYMSPGEITPKARLEALRFDKVLDWNPVTFVNWRLLRVLP